MIEYGGSFAEALGKTLQLADPDNAERIVKAFPELMERFKPLIPKMKEEHAEEDRKLNQFLANGGSVFDLIWPKELKPNV